MAGGTEAIVALIPARAGSKRIPGKNTRLLGGKPLLVWSIESALASGLFSAVYVSTEDYNTGSIAERAGAKWIWRSPTLARDDSKDIDWMTDLVERLKLQKETFAILRPTSPFRTAETLRRAYKEFTIPDGTHDSLRAVEPVKQHPGKMWEWAGPGYPIRPLFDKKYLNGTPWHSCPTQSLPTYYVQNSSLEMGWVANLTVRHTIHGRKVIPFFTEGDEGFSLDYPEDWDRAEAILARRARHRRDTESPSDPPAPPAAASTTRTDMPPASA